MSSCLVTIKRFTRAGGFSRRVAQQVSLTRRPSSRAGYQSKWLVFSQWCRSEGHSISHPSLPKIADFLFWLRRYRRLSVSSVMGYRSMLSAVFKSVLPEISISPVLHVLLRSFQAEAPIREVRPPSWDLNMVSSFFTILVFSAVDNYFITGFDPQAVVFAFVGYRKEGGGVRFRLCHIVFLSLHLLLVCHMCRSW